MYRIKHAFMYTCIVAIASLLTTSLLWHRPILLTGILLAMAVLMIMLYKDPTDIYLFILCGISGAIAESVAVFYGAWNYSNPSNIGIPYWLPLLWGLAGLYIKRLSLKIEDYIKKH